MKKLNILITGGLGFIGKNLISELLVNKNYHVIIIDNEYRWKREDASFNFNKEEIEYVKGDILNENLIKSLINKSDVVVHLAGISQVMTSIEDPDKAFLYNTQGTFLIAKYCSLFNKKLIFSSSREVYGNVKVLPVNLNNSLKPENPYAASKISGESIIISYGHTFGLKYIIFRLSNVYGAGDKGRVVPIFFNKAFKNEDLVLFGNKKIIDFIHIDDVVSVFLKALENDKINSSILNIGSGRGISLEKLATLVVKITNSKSKIIVKSERMGEVDRFTANIDETLRLLKNWNIKVDLESGLKRIANCKEKK